MIVDTNAISALASADPNLVSLLRSKSFVFLPIIVIGEYRYGIQQSRYKSRLIDWFAQFVQTNEILYLNLDTIRTYSGIRSQLRAAGAPIPANDVWIAALSLQHNLPIISRDQHFDYVDGIRRINW